MVKLRIIDDYEKFLRPVRKIVKNLAVMIQSMTVNEALPVSVDSFF